MLRFVQARQSEWEPDLKAELCVVPGFSVKLSVNAPTHMTISGHVDYKRRTISALGDGGCFVAHVIRLDGSNLPGSTTGDNIPNHGKHYCVLPLHGYALLEAGEHILELWARSDGSAAPGIDGQAEVKKGYNEMLIRLETAEG